jgi:hypothetical protein
MNSALSKVGLLWPELRIPEHLDPDQTFNFDTAPDPDPTV